MINITGVDLVKFAQKVYELSLPQGSGFLYFTPEPLSEERAKVIVERGKDSKWPLEMDYVYGRACKMTVFSNDGKLEIHDSWYDHTDEQFINLLSEFNIKLESVKEHNAACNCINCSK